MIELERTSGLIVGRVNGYRPVLKDADGESRGIGHIDEAIYDIQSAEVGNPDPEYIRRMSGVYERDARVRQLVLQRANGRCEYCGESAFEKQNGEMFLESHHIISLSTQGPDQLNNVIALCPNHHREAHYGKRWERLQNEFLEIVGKLTL